MIFKVLIAILISGSDCQSNCEEEKIIMNDIKTFNAEQRCGFLEVAQNQKKKKNERKKQ